MEKKQVRLNYIHCASCAANIESCLENIKGVYSAVVNFLSQKLIVEFEHEEISLEQIIKILDELGYKVSKNTSRFNLIKNYKMLFIMSLVLSSALVIVSWAGFNYNYILVLLLATTIQFYIGLNIYKNFLINFKNKIINSNTLILLGIFTCYSYGLFSYLNNDYTYLNISAIMVTLIILGKYIENILKSKFENGVKKFINIEPKTAVKFHNNKETIINTEEIKVNDILIARSGEIIPADGVIVKGTAIIDESILEINNHVQKSIGHNVTAGTINKEGVFYLKVHNFGENTLVSNIVKEIDNSGNMTDNQKTTTSLTNYFIFATILISILSSSVLYYLGFDKLFIVNLFLSFLIIGSPCIFGFIYTPIVSGVNLLIQKGILVKNTEVFSRLNKVNTIVIDKNSVLTTGKPEILEIIGLNKYKEKDVLKYAGIAEKSSDHLIANIIMQKVKEKRIEIPITHDFKNFECLGIYARHFGKDVVVGSKKFFIKMGVDTSYIETKIEFLEDEGKRVVLVGVNKKIIGLITFSDKLQDNNIETISHLYNLVKDVIMISSESHGTSKALATKFGIKTVIADILPEEKADYIRKLQEQGKIIACIGSNNDALMLNQSDVSISIYSGENIESIKSNIIFLKNDLSNMVNLLNYSRVILNKIKQNLSFGYLYNVFSILILAGFLSFFAGSLSPIISTIFMISSSAIVLLNSLNLK